MSLPKEYVVKTRTKEESSEVVNFVYKTSRCWDQWNYIVVSSDLPRGFNMFDYKESLEKYTSQGLPIYTFQEWKQLIEKNNLPEKWCILRTKDNEKEINEYFMSVSDPYAFIDDDHYLTSDHIRLKKWISAYVNKPQGFTKIDLNTFRQITNTMKEEKSPEIKGYKLIKKEYEKAAEEIGRDRDLIGFTRHTGYDKDNIIYLAGSTQTIENLKNAGVLDLWFTPIYKEIVKTETIEVGTPSKRIYMDSKGKLEITGIIGDTIFSISTVEALIKTIENSIVPSVSSYKSKIYSFWIGCESDGTQVGLTDLKKVRDTYYKLNKEK